MPPARLPGQRGRYRPMHDEQTPQCHCRADGPRWRWTSRWRQASIATASYLGARANFWMRRAGTACQRSHRCSRPRRDDAAALAHQPAPPGSGRRGRRRARRRRAAPPRRVERAGLVGRAAISRSRSDPCGERHRTAEDSGRRRTVRCRRRYCAGAEGDTVTVAVTNHLPSRVRSTGTAFASQPGWMACRA